MRRSLGALATVASSPRVAVGAIRRERLPVDLGNVCLGVPDHHIILADGEFRRAGVTRGKQWLRLGVAKAAKMPGAICAVGFDGEERTKFVPPRLVSFTQSLDFVASTCDGCGLRLDALDQHTVSTVPFPAQRGRV